MNLPPFPTYELLTAAPEHLRVHVDYYNDDHKRKLTDAPCPDSITKIAGKTIEVPTQDFLAYYLFWKQRQRPDIYSRLAAVRADRIYDAAGELNDLITFRGGTLASESGIEEGNSTTTGRLGEAMSLCVLNRIHDTGPGDWLALPEKRDQIPSGLRPMDFRIQTASDGKRIVQVESKGSFIPRDPKDCTDSVKKHARDIAKKKQTHENVPEASSGIWQADLRYGTITTFGQPGTSDAHCWLLDPPTEGEGDPMVVRTLARLLYSTNLLQLIAPRSYLTVALVNRVASLLDYPEIETASGRPLLLANGESFEKIFDRGFEDFSFQGSCISTFFTNRTTIRDYPAGGIITRQPGGPFLFLGMREDLLALTALQKFDALRSFQNKPLNFDATIDAVIPAGQAVRMGLPTGKQSQGPYHRTTFVGRILASSGGFVFGEVVPKVY